MSLRGLPVFEVEGVRWGIHRSYLYTSLPFHLQVDTTREELDAVFRGRRVPGIRLPSLHMSGTGSGFFVCRPQGYDLSRVDRRQRSHVRQGLERYEVHSVDPEELRREGLALNCETMQRQGRYDSEFGDAERWSTFVCAVAKCPEFSVTGAYADGRLCCYVIACQEDGWLHLLYKNSRTAELAQYVNHALDFSILQSAGQTPAIHAVGNYFAAYPANSGLNQYKRQMGFSLVETNLCTFFHPRLAPWLVNRATVGAVCLAREARPKDERLDAAARLLQGARISNPVEASQPADSGDPCQHADGLIYSQLRRSHFRFLVWWHIKRMRQENVAVVVKDVVTLLVERIRPKKKRAAAPRPYSPEEALGLQPGDWVEVKSESEILATLDKSFKNRGLVFSREMRNYCGQRFQVVKRVEKIFLEESGQQRKMQNTVLLEKVHCQGADFECDRRCYFFWRELWLRKVEAPVADEEAKPARARATQLLHLDLSSPSEEAQPLCQAGETLGSKGSRKQN